MAMCEEARRVDLVLEAEPGGHVADAVVAVAEVVDDDLLGSGARWAR